MEARIAALTLAQPLLLDELLAWMDGGTVTLQLIDRHNQAVSVEFVQRMSLKQYPHAPTPGSFVFENEEVPIRSTIETQLLKSLRQLRFKETLRGEQLQLSRQLIQQSIAFVESDDYLRVARLMGRL